MLSRFRAGHVVLAKILHRHFQFKPVVHHAYVHRRESLGRNQRSRYGKIVRHNQTFQMGKISSVVLMGSGSVDYFDGADVHQMAGAYGRRKLRWHLHLCNGYIRDVRHELHDAPDSVRRTCVGRYDRRERAHETFGVPFNRGGRRKYPCGAYRVVLLQKNRRQRTDGQSYFRDAVQAGNNRRRNRVTGCACYAYPCFYDEQGKSHRSAQRKSRKRRDETNRNRPVQKQGVSGGQRGKYAVACRTNVHAKFLFVPVRRLFRKALDEPCFYCLHVRAHGHIHVLHPETRQKIRQKRTLRNRYDYRGGCKPRNVCFALG